MPEFKFPKIFAVSLFFVFAFILCGCAVADEAAKIVVMDPMLSQWVLAIKCVSGVNDLLITEVGKSDYMSAIFPGLKDNIMRKKIDNTESLLLLNPKIVFVKKYSEHENSDFKKSGLKIVSVEFEKLDDILNGVKTIGESLQFETRAVTLIEHYKKAIDEVNESVAKIVKTARPRVYFANSNIYNSFGAGMFQNFLIETAGGISVTSNASGSKIQTSVEELIKWDPEIIVTASYCSDTPDLIIKNDKLKDLNAVKNKKIFVMPHYVTSWDMPVPESLPGIMWLASKFNPGLNTGLNDRIKEFYKIFYNIKIDDAEIEKIMK